MILLYDLLVRTTATAFMIYAIRYVLVVEAGLKYVYARWTHPDSRVLVEGRLHVGRSEFLVR